MTLILALANKEFVLQIADRRLSSNGRLIDDESNKCGVIFCLNARMVFGYTGLARAGHFSTREWLLTTLHNSAAPEYTIGEILEKVRKNATDIFNNDPSLKNIPKAQKKLAVMLSGFINIDGKENIGCAILSNFHNFENNTAFDVAQDEFFSACTQAKRDEKNPTMVQRVGAWHAMADDDIDEMRQMLAQGKPGQAVVGKALELVREIAGRPQSAGLIGKQLTSILIRRSNSTVESSYSTEKVKLETYVPSLVYLLPDQHLTVDGISVSPVDRHAIPMSVPKVGRNVPCPCKSGKKYKWCHGK